jgi:hypothetical protein
VVVGRTVCYEEEGLGRGGGSYRVLQLVQYVYYLVSR